MEELRNEVAILREEKKHLQQRRELGIKKEEGQKKPTLWQNAKQKFHVSVYVSKYRNRCFTFIGLTSRNFWKFRFFLMLNACDINLTEFIASLKINCALYNHPQQELALADA
jgi:hypothetical protein